MRQWLEERCGGGWGDALGGGGSGVRGRTRAAIARTRHRSRAAVRSGGKGARVCGGLVVCDVHCRGNTVRAAAAEWRGTEAREARERQHARKPFAQAVKGDGGGGLHNVHLRLSQRRLHARRAARRAALDSSKSCEAHEKRQRDTEAREAGNTDVGSSCSSAAMHIVHDCGRVRIRSSEKTDSGSSVDGSSTHPTI